MMRKRLFAGILVLAILLGALCGTVVAAEDPCEGYSDINRSAWYHEYVDFVIEAGLMNSTSTTELRFEPNTLVSRAMVVALMHRLTGEEEVEYKASFPDVKEGKWYTMSIEWAAQNGLASGTDNGFLPNDPVTREQLAMFMYKLAEYGGYLGDGSADLGVYPDNGKFGAWAKTALSWAVDFGILSGREKNGQKWLEPKASASRAEFASIICRLQAKLSELIVGDKLRVALVTDYGDISDESFNQAAYAGAKEWCEENAADFSYYKPTDDSTEARVAAIEQAIADGHNVLVLPGFVFAGAIVETVEKYPDVKFLALDISEFDLQDAHGTADDFSWVYPDNLFSAVYKEEIAGYMAGFAAVQLGYTKLGFLGGMEVPAVVRYGYGFVQGANDAAKELEITDQVELNYLYANQFFGDEDVTAAMEDWYAAGTETVFACGGGIYTSVCQAAAKNGGKVIGVDVDQATAINAFGENMALTSAMKGISATVQAVLSDLAADNWDFYGGRVEPLGLVSEIPEENFVQLAPSTQWNEGFTQEDYASLVSDLLNGTYIVSDQTESAPAVEITVDYQGSIKK